MRIKFSFITGTVDEAGQIVVHTGHTSKEYAERVCRTQGEHLKTYKLVKAPGAEDIRDPKIGEALQLLPLGLDSFRVAYPAANKDYDRAYVPKGEKFTPVQRDLLLEIFKAGPKSMSDKYKPARLLVEAGMLRKQDRNLSSPLFTLTDAGMAEVKQISERQAAS